MASKKVLEHYLRQLRLIEEHREKWCYENVRRHYKDLMTNLNEFLGVQYAQLAQDDKLTYEILHGKAQYARFLEEVEQRIDKFSPQAAQEIRNTVQLTYEYAYKGMVNAVEKAGTVEELHSALSSVRAVTPEIIKNVVQNKIMEKALEKNHKGLIYNIRQQIGIGLSQGDRMSTMAKRLSTQVEGGYKKAMLIARTEVHRAREAGYQDSSERISQVLKDNDSDYVMTKTWKTMQDMSVRPYRMIGKKGKKSFVKGKGADHIKMHGITVLVEDEFDLGDGAKAKAPGQSSVAAHDCNCRCYLSRDLMTKAEYEKLTGKKFKEDYKIAQYETEEKILLDEKKNLESEKGKLEKRQENLKSYEYTDVDGKTITPADYDATKLSVQKFGIQSKIDAVNDDEIDAIFRRCGKDNVSGISYELEHKMGLSAKQKYDMRYSKLQSFDGDSDALKAYIKQQAKLYRSDMQKILDGLNDFEIQGKNYLKLSKRIKEIDNRLFGIDDDVREVRHKLMKAKGIDPDKIQKEIDDLVGKISKMDKPIDLSELRSRNVYGSIKGETILESDGSEKYYRKWVKDYEDAGKPSIGDFEKKYDAYKAFFDEVDALRNNTVDVKEINKLKKLLESKQDELKKIIERYDLKPKIKIAPRTESAKILNTLQDFANKDTIKFDSSIDKFARKLGISKTEARAKTAEALSEIIDECDIGMRIKVSNLEKVLADTDGGFKNLFETGTGGGCTNFTSRGNGEKRVFGYSKAVPTGTDVGDRPVYGMMIPNLQTNRTAEAIDYINSGPGSWYGDGVTVVINKNKVRNNTSFTLGDSLDYSSELFGSTFDNPQFNGAFYDFGDTIKSFVDKSKSPNEKLMHTFSRSDKYMEVQIHGKDNHSADIIEKVYFDQKAFDKATKKGLIKKLDSRKIPYEVLKK